MERQRSVKSLPSAMYDLFIYTSGSVLARNVESLIGIQSPPIKYLTPERSKNYIDWIVASSR